MGNRRRSHIGSGSQSGVDQDSRQRAVLHGRASDEWRAAGIVPAHPWARARRRDRRRRARCQIAPVGDRVGVPWVQASCGRCEWCLRGRPMFCPNLISTGLEAAGGPAEYMPAYVNATMLLPDGLSYEQAAPIFCAGYTVWSGLRWADPQPHERVAVVGIGGLGHLALQYAKAAGFETVAVSHSSDKDKQVRELGADEIVRDGKGLAAAGGVDIILGTSNSNDAMADAMQGLRPDGRFVLMGFESKPLPVSPADLIVRRIKIVGSQQNGREYLYEALDYVAKGKVKVIAETYPLAEVNRAYDRVAEGKVRFRAVIVNNEQ